MFDSYSFRPDSSNKCVTVIEKRAPTDDSVNLLREMEKAAKASVIRAVNVVSNEIKGVVHHRKNFLNNSDQFRVIFDLNGVRKVVDHEVFKGSSNDAISEIVDKVSRVIAVEILRGPLSETFTKVFRSTK